MIIDILEEVKQAKFRKLIGEDLVMYAVSEIGICFWDEAGTLIARCICSERTSERMMSECTSALDLLHSLVSEGYEVRAV